MIDPCARVGTPGIDPLRERRNRRPACLRFHVVHAGVSSPGERPLNSHGCHGAGIRSSSRACCQMAARAAWDDSPSGPGCRSSQSPGGVYSNLSQWLSLPSARGCIAKSLQLRHIGATGRGEATMASKKQRKRKQKARRRAARPRHDDFMVLPTGYIASEWAMQDGGRQAAAMCLSIMR